MSNTLEKKNAKNLKKDKLKYVLNQNIVDDVVYLIIHLILQQNQHLILNKFTFFLIY